MLREEDVVEKESYIGRGKVITIYAIADDDDDDDEEPTVIARYVFSGDELAAAARRAAPATLTVSDSTELRILEAAAEMARDARQSVRVDGRAATIANTDAKLLIFTFLRAFGENNPDVTNLYAKQLEKLAPSQLGPEQKIFIGNHAAFRETEEAFDLTGNELIHIITDDAEGARAELMAYFEQKGFTDKAQINAALKKVSITLVSPITAVNSQYQLTTAAKIFTTARLTARIRVEDLPKADNLVIAYLSDSFPAVRTRYDGALKPVLEALQNLDLSKYDYKILVVKAMPIDISSFMRFAEKALIAIDTSA
jgi:hypothetical protein